MVFIPTYSKETALYDTLAIKNDIDKASMTAESYVTDMSESGIFVHTKDSAQPTSPETLGNYGVHISDSVNIISDGDVIASYGDIATIGKNGETRSIVDSDSYSIVDADDAPLFNVRTYETTVSNYAAAYKGNPSSAGAVFRLRYAVKHQGTTVIPNINKLSVSLSSTTSMVQMIVDGEFVNGDPSSLWFSPDYQQIRINSTWLQQYLPSWTPRTTVQVYCDVQLQETQIVDTASVKIGEVYPEEDYKLVVAADSLDGSIAFSVDGNGKLQTPQIQAGRIAGKSVSGNSFVEEHVIFEHPMSNAPTVIASLESTSTSPEIGYISVATHDAAVDGFWVRIFNAGPSTRIPAVNWLAINT